MVDGEVFEGKETFKKIVQVFTAKIFPLYYSNSFLNLIL